MSVPSRPSRKEEEEVTDLYEEVVEEREFRTMTSPNPQPSLLVETLLAELTQQLRSQAEQSQRQAEQSQRQIKQLQRTQIEQTQQMQRSQMEQGRELERRLSDMAVSQHETMTNVHEVMTSVMSRVERLEVSTHERTDPGLWSEGPEVSSRCDLASSSKCRPLGH